MRNSSAMPTIPGTPSSTEVLAPASTRTFMKGALECDADVPDLESPAAQFPKSRVRLMPPESIVRRHIQPRFQSVKTDRHSAAVLRRLSWFRMGALCL